MIPNIPFTIKVEILSTIFFLIFASKNIVINFKIIIILKNIYVKNLLLANTNQTLQI